MSASPNPVTVCPACKKTVESEHVFCPHCGTRISPAPTPPSPPRSLKNDLDDVRKVGFWIAFFITLPTLTFPAFLVNFISPGEMGVDEAASIWQTIVLTAPLTAAVIITILAIHYEWFTNGCLGTLFIAAVLAATTLISSAFGVGAGVDVAAIWRADYHPVAFLNNMIRAYYQIYGFWSFASSLLVGSFIAWIWIAKVMPYLQQDVAD